MNIKSKTKATIGMLLGLSLAAVIPSPAMAASTDGTAPAPQDVQTQLDSFTAEKNVSVPAAPRRASAGTTVDGVSTNAVSSRRASGRTGSDLHYHELNVDFYFDWSRVTSSYAWQNGSAFGLNTIELTGVQKSYDDGWTHNHHASAQVGIGVPTPWGGVNVYEETINLFSRVHGDGAWGLWN